METSFDNYRLYEIDNLFRPDECNNFIDIIENKRMEPINNKIFKNQYRITFSDSWINQEITERLIPHNLTYSKKKFRVLNDKIHYVKYYNGSYMQKHRDMYAKNNILSTLIIYLNDNYNQGETYLYNPKMKTSLSICAKTGKGFVFPGSDILHGCRKVVGIKKVLIVGLIFE